MSTKKYLDSNGLIYLWTKIKTALNGKVNIETGKGLSTNDYTTAEKTKLAGIPANADNSPDISTNVTTDKLSDYMTVSPKAVWDFIMDRLITTGIEGIPATDPDETIPSVTAVRDYLSYFLDTAPAISGNTTDTEHFTTPATVAAYVTSVISGLSGAGVSFSVVDTLPTSDISTSTIYLVAKTGGGTSDTYDEYMYINSAWELIGTTAVDLSDYQIASELIGLTNAEIDTAVSNAEAGI